MKYEPHLRLVNLSGDDRKFCGLVTHVDEQTSKSTYQLVVHGRDENDKSYNIVLFFPKKKGAVKAVGTYEIEGEGNQLDIMGMVNNDESVLSFDGTFVETHEGGYTGYGKIKLEHRL